MPKAAIQNNQVPVVLGVMNLDEGMAYFDRVPIFDPSRPMKVADVANLLRVNPRAVYRMVEAGCLKATKLNGTFYFNPREVYASIGMEDYLPKEVEVV